jgi:2-polyprenyl-6-hydroxyphenyl methylase/3-demethylubiquinone-9 3-methyltransferase
MVKLMASTASAEIATGERFAFGQNWRNFLATMNDERIAQAENSLREMLEVQDLRDKTFLDIGSGSGLFSLAARRLGARVHSFDFDPSSVACTQELRRRYLPESHLWTVEHGSALDRNYVTGLGQFDVVYSWGVLHHTGDMWRALENAHFAVRPGGTLFIAIYNDTGSQAARWKTIKRVYNQLPSLLRRPYAIFVTAPAELKALTRHMLAGRPQDYVRSWTQYSSRRGMSRWHDILDWVGGYPYEVATPDEIFEFYKTRGFTLTKLRCGHVGLGCAEFVFCRRV